MSSSDEDICDFTSNFEKFMNKKTKIFHTNFDSKPVDLSFIDSTKSDDNPVSDDVLRGESSIAGIAEPVPTSSAPNVVEIDDASPSEINNSEVIEIVGDNSITIDDSMEVIQDRINNKFERMQELMNNIIHDNSPRGRRRGRRSRGGGRSGIATDNPYVRQTRSTRVARGQRGSRRGRQIHIGPARQIETAPAVSTPQIIDYIDIDDEKEDYNPLVIINVEWSCMEKNYFKVKKFQRLDVIFDFYLKKTTVDPRLLYFTLDDKEIDLNHSSYVGLRLKKWSIIEGVLLPEKHLTREIKPIQFVPDGIKLKVQNASLRGKHFTVYVRMDEDFSIVTWQIMEEMDLNFEQIKIYFDGSVIKPTDTITSLDIEEDDCLDVVVNT